MDVHRKIIATVLLLYSVYLGVGLFSAVFVLGTDGMLIVFLGTSAVMLMYLIPSVLMYTNYPHHHFFGIPAAVMILISFPYFTPVGIYYSWYIYKIIHNNRLKQGLREQRAAP